MCHTEVPGGTTIALPAHRAVEIAVPSGESMPATLYVGRKARAAVLLIADIHGPSPFYETLASRLAHAGLAVLLPDYFFRQGPAGGDLAAAMERRRGLDEQNTLHDLSAAADWLGAEFATPRVGVLGFCMGGTFALDLASTREDLVTVAYYGFPVPAETIVTPPSRPLDLVGSLSGPVLAFWGDQDKGVGLDNVHTYIAAARDANPDFDAEVLEGHGHAFLVRSDLDDPADAGGATWARTLQHFRTHLGARRGGRGGGPRVRLPRRQLTVTKVTQLTPQLVRVHASGDLSAWERALPGAHAKIFVPDGDDAAMRTYTVRDADSSGVVVDFGIHADGPATRWARTVAPGAEFEIAGEARGGFAPKPDTAWCLLLADHCAIPAVAAIVETLPADVSAVAVVELTDAADALPVDSAAAVQWQWPLEYGEPGDALIAALESLELPGGPGEIWVGCEAGAMRRIRRYLLDNALVERHRLHPRAYWKKDVANHSDHDTGDD